MTAPARTRTDSRSQADLEVAVLAGLFREPDPPRAWLDRLTVEDFTISVHRTIFGAALAVAADGPKWHVVGVVDRLGTAGQLDAVGGPAYVIGLAESTFTTALFPFAAESLLIRTARRALCELVVMLSEFATADDDDALVAKIGFAAVALRNVLERLSDGDPA